MTTTLVMPEKILTEIEQATLGPLETAGVIIAVPVVSDSGDIRLLVHKIRWLDEQAYTTREPDRLSIKSSGYVEPLAEAASIGAFAIWFHTHPRGISTPEPSESDRQVDAAIAEPFRIRTGSPLYASLIGSIVHDELAFTGILYMDDGKPVPIDRIWQVGGRWRLIQAFMHAQPISNASFDRNIRAFGQRVQMTLGDLRIAIIGCGGTGSAVAEQLVRLGVRHLTLIDNDILTTSNITRVYGSVAADAGKHKAEVLRLHLSAIAPDLICESILSRVTVKQTAQRLTKHDLIFGCTDDNAGRLVLSRIPTYLLTPVIDLGVLLSSTKDNLLCGIHARVTIVGPGDACLVCRDRIDLQRAAVELKTPEERIRLADEGYAPALEGIEPAVITFTTAAASSAVSELLERLIGYGPQPRPSEILLRLHDREISTNIAPPRIGHYCDTTSANFGAGITDPFLGQLWP